MAKCPVCREEIVISQHGYTTDAYAVLDHIERRHEDIWVLFAGCYCPCGFLGRFWKTLGQHLLDCGDLSEHIPDEFASAILRRVSHGREA